MTTLLILTGMIHIVYIYMLYLYIHTHTHNTCILYIYMYIYMLYTNIIHISPKYAWLKELWLPNHRFSRPLKAPWDPPPETPPPPAGQRPPSGKPKRAEIGWFRRSKRESLWRISIIYHISYIIYHNISYGEFLSISNL